MEAVELDSADLVDPNPDIHSLFCYYNDLYFGGKLGSCTVDWSTSRMTLCAGICKYNVGGGCAIRLSEPLLKYRSSAELKETLLHEMIHAYLWLTGGNKDHEDHGFSFRELMQEINTSKADDHQRPDKGYDITIYHNFGNEVDSYRRHHWMCRSCGDIIKRAQNRPPSQSDCIFKSAMSQYCHDERCHWHRHQMICGGDYIKTAEPEGYQDRRKHPGKQDGEMNKLPGMTMRRSGIKQIGSSMDTNSVKEEELDCTEERKSKPLEMFFPTIDRTERKNGEDVGTIKLPAEACKPDSSGTLTGEDLEEESTKIREEIIDEKRSQVMNKIPVSENHGMLKTSLGKRQHRTDEFNQCCRQSNNCTVIIGWKGWCAFEGEEDEKGVEALINKRWERRKEERARKLVRIQEDQHCIKVERQVELSQKLESHSNEATTAVSESIVTELGNVMEVTLELPNVNKLQSAEEVSQRKLYSQQSPQLQSYLTGQVHKPSNHLNEVAYTEFMQREGSGNGSPCLSVSTTFTEVRTGVSKDKEEVNNQDVPNRVKCAELSTFTDVYNNAILESDTREKMNASNGPEDVHDPPDCQKHAASSSLLVDLRHTSVVAAGVQENKNDSNSIFRSTKRVKNEVSVIQINDTDEDGDVVGTEHKDFEVSAGCVPYQDISEDGFPLDVKKEPELTQSRVLNNSKRNTQDTDGFVFVPRRKRQGRGQGVFGENGKVGVNRTIVSPEERGKRVRENSGDRDGDAEAGEELFVCCPLCCKRILGDIENQEFNVEVNRHIDNCMGSS